MKAFIPALPPPSARRAVRHLLAGVALALLQACASALRPLPGVRVTPEHTAALYISNPQSAVLALDDTRFDPPLVVDSATGSEYPIPSGHHTIELQHSWGPQWRTNRGRPMPPTTISVLAFEAESGHHYYAMWDVAKDPAGFTHDGKMVHEVRRAVSPQIVDLRGRRVVSRVLRGGPDEVR